VAARPPENLTTTATKKAGHLVWPFLTCALLAWGALAFGAVYTWSWVPLVTGCAGLGLAGISAGLRRRTLHRGLGAAVAAIVIAASLQLVPLPERLLEILSPAATRFLAQYDLAYALASTGAGELRSLPTSAPAHPLSIDPPATLIGLAFLVALGLLFLGLPAILSGRHARRVADGVLVLGLVLAFIGLVQKAAGDGAIYGFWRPLSVGDPFGPFVNKNHFAGWMLLALPLGLGRFCERLAGVRREVRPAWRNQLMWFSSLEASRLILSGVALLVMGLSVVMTMSRSGIASLTIALGLLVLLVARAGMGRGRILALAYVGGLLSASIGWAGADAVGHRFTASIGPDLIERSTAWGDAIAVTRDFPLTGTGLNTYGTATILYQSPELTQYYSAAHSDYLQLAAEGGLLLGLPALAIVATFVRALRSRLRQRDDAFWLRAGAAVGLVAIALQELVEFSLQIPANTALFVVVAAIAIHPATIPPARPDLLPDQTRRG
jgi:putative inorganic carbon (hco3(-)) transporter